MSQKVVNLPGIGDVVLAKRKGTRNLRLSIGADGRVRVGLPNWAPYDAGIRFAKSRSDWIREHIPESTSPELRDNMRIGKSYRLKLISDTSVSRPTGRIAGGQIFVRHSPSHDTLSVQRAAAVACERALKKEAEKLLPIRLRELAIKSGKSYRSVKIKKLRSRWGSCSSQKDITLNYYLIQLPWSLIDYVILHELAHTTHMHHGPGFWEHMQQLLPEVKSLRKEIKNHKPMLTPVIA